MIVAAASLISVIAGVGIACAAERFPVHVRAMETGAGALLIGGFALMGCLLPPMM
jgi:hypothetical protein